MSVIEHLTSGSDVAEEVGGGGGRGSGIAGIENPQLIGHGRFGVVYRATHPAFGRTVAVKVMRAELGRVARRRFERECEALRPVSAHPNIVRVLDAGTTSGRRPYVVTDYLPGGSLGWHLRMDGRMPLADVLENGVKLAGALESAHSAGLLHRDIKPDNILCSASGEVALTDFRFSRIVGSAEGRTGVFFDALAHTAPEILSNRDASPSSDVYSLASTVFALIDGHAPFILESDQTLVSLIARIINATVPDLRPSGVPDDVAWLIEAALAKDPKARLSSASDLGRALQAVQASLGLPETTMVTAEREDSIDVEPQSSGIFTTVPENGRSPTMRGGGERVRRRPLATLLARLGTGILRPRSPALEQSACNDGLKQGDSVQTGLGPRQRRQRLAGPVARRHCRRGLRPRRKKATT